MTWIIAGCIAAALLIAIIACIVFLCRDPNPRRPAHIDGANGFVQAHGTNLYDGDGNLLQLKGVNLGNWFIQEPWMSLASVGNFDTGHYTQRRGRTAMRLNPNLDEDQIARLEQIYLDHYIREEDVRTIAALGMNTVRIPFSYMNLTEGGALRPDAFAALDRAISWCKKYGLYAVLDLHGAPGSQNMDHHSGDDAHFDLYGNAENEARTEALWRQIARHYRGERAVAGYDLLNEPRRRPHRYGGRVNFDYYDRLYRAVREEDPDHLLFIECFSFPVNGARLRRYGWKNICMEYHIYNLTPFSQKTCLRLYKALHNWMGYRTPVLIGEWNAYGRQKDWQTYFAYFDKLGWSFASWTYKTNAYFYRRDRRYRNLYVRTHGEKDKLNWGMFELDLPPVDISKATYQEIAAAYEASVTENAQRSGAYAAWERYLRNCAARRKLPH